MHRSSFALIICGAAIVAATIMLALHLLPDGRSGKMATKAANTVVEAINLFKDEGFNPEVDLKVGELKIPRVFLASLPGDLHSVPNIGQRKVVFVTVVLAHVLWVNDQLREHRARILRLRKANLSGKVLRHRDRRWLERIAGEYRTKPMAFGDLLRRVDIVPPRLAVAQAVQESGWGTSRFARTGNALFGQHAPVGAGAITARGDARVGLKAFDTIQRSVLGYMQNLNSHPAYGQFRRLRAKMRRDEKPINAMVLAGSLAQYSEEGGLYVDRLRKIMLMPEVAAARNMALAKDD
tara:strand:- start:2083 stop:2964 length:882 start_codon:yes stop_codon:yes gene_type:complete